MRKVAQDEVSQESSWAERGLPLDELARLGARKMIEDALFAEVDDYLARHQGARDAVGHALVVRNGKARSRPFTVGSGTVSITAPRVNDRRVVDGERMKFTSKILPPYLRRSPKVSEVLPVLYLRGLSTGDFREALTVLLGDDASGLSPSAITRLTAGWQDEYRAWNQRSLADRDYVYVWVDGVHFNVRLEDERLACLVVIGARPDGTKEVIALEDGYRESTESWKSLLRNLKKRGMRAPVVAVGDGALGFWAALRDVWPQTREQRCWVHVIANVLDKLPKGLQPKAKSLLHAAMNAPDKKTCEQHVAEFAEEYGAKYPKAVASLSDNAEKLQTHFDFPAEHWLHLRTTNPIESTFATVKLRQRVTKGAGSRNAGLAMAFKLLLAAEQSWRKLNGAALLPLVREGAKFVNGKRVERKDKPKANNSKPIQQPQRSAA
jgi:putative transposase